MRFFSCQVLGLDPYRASATSILEIVEDLLSPGSRGGYFSVMTGPTNEAFLNPWRRYLEERGVVFHCGSRVTRMKIGGSRVVSLEMSNQHHPIAERDRVIWATPPGDAAQCWFETPLYEGMRHLADITQQWVQGIQLFLREKLLWSPEWGDRPIWGSIDSPWQIIAEPAEAIYQIPPQKGWMNDEKFRYHGSGDFADLWTLTLCDPYLPSEMVGKTWLQCRPDEIYREVWHQFTKHRSIYGDLSQVRDGSL